MKTEEIFVSLQKDFSSGELQGIQHQLMDVDGIAHVRIIGAEAAEPNLELEYYPLMLDEASVMAIIQKFDTGARAVV